MTFQEWYESISFAGGDDGDWYHHKYEELNNAWHSLESRGVAPDIIATVFSTLKAAIADQYGD